MAGTLLLIRFVGGGVIALPSFQKAFYGNALTPAAIAQLSSNVVSTLFGGAFVGSIATTPITGYIGRRYALMVSHSLYARVYLARVFVNSNSLYRSHVSYSSSVQ
jgi:hypothetical protein